MNYHFHEEESIDSPSLVYYRDWIEENTGKAIAMAGGAERLWPHVKTHKMAAVVRLQLARGITRFKCATIAEAEMCAREGAPHVLVAYPLVGPAIGRFLNLRARYTQTCFWVIGDDLSLLEKLENSVAECSLLMTLIDVNLGMNRTGVPLDALEEFCLAAARFEKLCIMGFHGYDGHIGVTDLGERKTAVSREVEKLLAVKASLEKRGHEIPVLVMGGTPSFPCHKDTAASVKGVYFSPGTIFINDHGYSSKYPDLPFTPAAAILSRVISHPAPGLFTLDTGCKAIAADQAERGMIADLPHAKPVAQSEEHWVWNAEGGPLPSIGTVLYIIPAHICPTSALYPGVHVVSGGRLAGYWEVSARNRFLFR